MELTDAKMFWVKMTQLAKFSYEISTLKAGMELVVNCCHSNSKGTYVQLSRLCHWPHKVTISEGIILGKPCSFGRWYVHASTACFGHSHASSHVIGWNSTHHCCPIRVPLIRVQVSYKAHLVSIFISCACNLRCQSTTNYNQLTQLTHYYWSLLCSVSFFDQCSTHLSFDTIWQLSM